VSDNLDESQDWPLRDYSARLRPPRPPDETVEPEPDPVALEPEAEREEPAFEPPPPARSGVEVLYDEDDLDAGIPEVSEPEELEKAPEQEPASESTPAATPEPRPPAEEPAAAVAAVADPEPAESDREPAVSDPEPAAETEVEVEEHAEGDLRIPGGTSVLEGSPNGNRRTVAIVVSRFNGEITGKLLDSAMTALDEAGVARDAVLVMPVPGAFELPIAAMALAKTRRYSCVVALGCVIRGETPHFDFVASEAASGLQLAGIETGVPVSFGLLTCDTAEQAEARVERGAWAARTALEMADAFAQLRTAVARG
jgi:6,7-dimethyl-8-ribityllumazine synthase